MKEQIGCVLLYIMFQVSRYVLKVLPMTYNVIVTLNEGEGHAIKFGRNSHGILDIYNLWEVF